MDSEEVGTPPATVAPVVEETEVPIKEEVEASVTQDSEPGSNAQPKMSESQQTNKAKKEPKSANKRAVCPVFLCKLCDVRLTSLVQAQQHFNSKLHLNKVQRREDMKNMDPVAVENRKRAYDSMMSWQVKTNMVQDTTTAEPVAKKKMSDEDSSCSLCSIYFNSKSSAEQHYNGKKHKLAVAADSGLPVVEAGSNPKDAVFKCELCDISLTSKSQLKQHMNGIRHQLKAGIIKEPPVWWVDQQIYYNKDKPEKGTAATTMFHCKVCDIKLNSELMVADHMQGKKHKDMAAYKSGEKVRGGVGGARGRGGRGRGADRGRGIRGGRGAGDRGRGGRGTDRYFGGFDRGSSRGGRGDFSRGRGSSRGEHTSVARGGRGAFRGRGGSADRAGRGGRGGRGEGRGGKGDRGERGGPGRGFRGQNLERGHRGGFRQRGGFGSRGGMHHEMNGGQAEYMGSLSWRSDNSYGDYNHPSKDFTSDIDYGVMPATAGSQNQWKSSGGGSLLKSGGYPSGGFSDVNKKVSGTSAAKSEFFTGEVFDYGIAGGYVDPSYQQSFQAEQQYSDYSNNQYTDAAFDSYYGT